MLGFSTQRPRASAAFLELGTKHHPGVDYISSSLLLARERKKCQRLENEVHYCAAKMQHYVTMHAFSIVAGGVTMRSFRFLIVFDSNEARD